ncbi:MAG TPA: carboxypeptidase regulatory-like domain-containing protein [Pirellulaceae bacterium]
MPASLFLGPTIPAVNAAEAVATVQDIRLDARGSLKGQLTDAQGRGIQGIPIAISQGANHRMSATTDADGGFSFAGLTGGTYQLTVEGTQRSYRMWSHDAAPPCATDGMLVVRPTELVRGQNGYGNPYAGGVPQATYPNGSPGMMPQSMNGGPPPGAMQGPYQGPVMDGSMQPGYDPNSMGPAYMGDPTMDGGMCCPPEPAPHRFGWLANPWVIGGAVAIAIAIPLALSDDDDDSAS